MEETLRQKVTDFSKLSDRIQTVIIFLLAFLVPSFLGILLKAIFGAESVVATNSQLIIGSIVNTCLVVAALNLTGWKKIMGVVTMPSISTIFSGVVFSAPTTMYMLWMIPAIWIGNFALIYAFKSIMLLKKKNYFVAGIVGIVVKVAVIFLGFLIVKAATGMPDKIATNLQTAMSLTQAITATIGTLIAFAIYKLETRKKLQDSKE